MEVRILRPDIKSMRAASILLFLGGFVLPGALISGHNARAELPDYPVAKLKTLDKITARTQEIELKVGETASYGPLLITVRTCRKSPPIESPRTAAFIEILEDADIEAEATAQNLVFSGWMFASSPGLSSMDHPVYDVWVIDCLGKPLQPGESAGRERPEKGISLKSLEQTIQDQQYTPEIIEKAREKALREQEGYNSTLQEDNRAQENENPQPSRPEQETESPGQQDKNPEEKFDIDTLFETSGE